MVHFSIGGKTGQYVHMCPSLKSCFFLSKVYKQTFPDLSNLHLCYCVNVRGISYLVVFVFSGALCGMNAGGTGDPICMKSVRTKWLTTTSAYGCDTHTDICAETSISF